MLKAPIPENDEARVAALEATGALDVGREERFDRFTRLAQRMFDVPIALISLVHRDKQFLKSVQGIDVSETARDISICGHAIMQDGAFVVEDASQDPRFADNPMVAGGPKIRFYAGHTLVSSDGHRIGTLCLVDSAPRDFSAADRESLADLATLVAAELSLLRLATIDELTGISNRRGFNMIAEQAMQICRRTNRNASLLLLDLDGFNAICTKLGTAYGDKALVEFASLLNMSFRDSDVVSRIGGDTFCVLLTDTDLENTWNTVERFRSALSARNALPGRKYRMLFSAAVVQCDYDRHHSSTRLLQEAEVLMHERKRAKPLPKREQAVCLD